MDFKESILEESEKKYQQMIDGEAQQPFVQSTNVSIVDNNIDFSKVAQMLAEREVQESKNQSDIKVFNNQPEFNSQTDFKESVLAEGEKKYQQMIDGETRQPFTQSTKVSILDNYIKLSDIFNKRLKREAKEFNDALDTITKRRNDRLSVESSHKYWLKEDIKIFLWSIAGVAVILGILLTLYFLGIGKGVALWVQNVMMKEAGFAVFFSQVGAGQIPLVLSLISGFAIGGIALIISIIWILIKHKSLKLIIASVFLTPIVIAIAFLVVRLLIALTCYLIYGIMTPVGLIVIGVILTILLGIFIYLFVETINYKIVGAVILIGLTAATAVMGALGFFIHNANKDYYKAHDGTTIEKAIEYNNYKYSNYYIEKESNSYIEFTPSETGLYQVEFDTVRSSGGLLLDLIANDRETLIDIDNKNYKDGIYLITYNLNEGQKYYFHINSISAHRECFSFEIKLISDDNDVNSKTIMNNISSLFIFSPNIFV